MSKPKKPNNVVTLAGARKERSIPQNHLPVNAIVKFPEKPGRLTIEKHRLWVEALPEQIREICARLDAMDVTDPRAAHAEAVRCSDRIRFNLSTIFQRMAFQYKDWTFYE